MKSIIVDGILYGSISEVMSKATVDMSDKKDKLDKFDKEIKKVFSTEQYLMIKKLYESISECNLVECEHYFSEGVKIGLKLGLSVK